MNGKQSDSREQRAWDDVFYDPRGPCQCAAYWCSARGMHEFCAAHQWEGVWYAEAYECEWDGDAWWTEQLSDYETQARQCVKAVIVADVRSSRAATHRLALLAIKALRRLPLDLDNGNGGTWRDSLQTVVDLAFETRD